MKLLRDKIKRDTYMVSKLSGMINRGDLRDNHPQQRKSGQWDNNTRDNFIQLRYVSNLQIKVLYFG